MSADDAGSVERELKFGAAPELQIPDLTGVLPGVEVVEAPALDLDATYVDTADLRLVRNGVSLRRRTGEGDPRWTLKLPSTSDDGTLARREIDVVDPGHEVPARLADLVTGWVRSGALVPVVVIRSRRRRSRLVDADGQDLAELADDDVTVVDGERTVGRFREVEVELAGGGSADLLHAVGGALVAAGAGTPDTTSKVARGLGDRADAPPDLVAPVLGPASLVAELVAAALVEPVGVVVATDHLLRLDDDPDGVRRARSALRRFRSHLALLSAVLEPDWVHEVRDRPRALLDALGAVRRTDAVSARLLRSVGALPADLRPPAVALVGRLDERRAGQMAEVRSLISVPDHVALLDGLVAAATAPRLVDDGQGPAASVAPTLVAPAWHRLRRAVRHLGHHPDAAALDPLRSAARSAQGGAALVAPIVGEPAALLARGLADLREVLGVVHHGTRAATWLDEVVPTVDGAERSAGEALRQLQHDDVDAARHRWRDAWAVCDSPEASGWLG